MSIPVLLLVFKRPDNTREIYGRLDPEANIYIFVDHDEENSENNQLVKEYSQIVTANPKVKINLQSRNLGPGAAMINALDWVFESENFVWILEDDVFPNSHANQYLNLISSQIEQKANLIATTRSPFTISSSDTPTELGVSKFALTNGWLLTREVWDNFNLYLQQPLLMQFMKFAFFNPLSIRIEHFYFFSASYLSRKKIVSAWDTQFVFYCLIRNVKTVTPNKSCVEIRGVDDVASNTLIKDDSMDDVFWKADSIAPASQLSVKRSLSKKYDSSIRKNIYQIHWWHLFSPLKAYLRVVKKRLI